MDLQNSNNGENQNDHQNPNNGDFDSACSTPFVSAPSSPGRTFFFSAPSSPMHYVLISSMNTKQKDESRDATDSLDFEFSARFTANDDDSAADADELFLNGKIRPTMRLSPLKDLDGENDVVRRDPNLRCRSVRRRARSHSPSRNPSPLLCSKDQENQEPRTEIEVPSTASRSSSSSSSSSTGRTSKRWLFFKDLLLRSKSEGHESQRKENFWHSISFSVSSKKASGSSSAQERPAIGSVHRRRRASASSPSPHERHYTANRAQAEEMRRRTALPYRQQHGILGCLGFSSRNFGAINGFASRTLNTVYSS